MKTTVIYGGGFESAAIYFKEKDRLEVTDALRLSNHDTRCKEDFGLIEWLELGEFRFSIPWNRIQPSQGTYDWEWTDQALELLALTGANVIADPFHFCCPPWLTGSFTNPDAPKYYLEYLMECVHRYSWIPYWNIVNEPLTVAVKGGLSGNWFPWHSSDNSFVALSYHLAKAINEGSRLIKNLRDDYKIIHIDPTERHDTHSPDSPESDADSLRNVEFYNQRRFLIPDLALGQVSADHPLAPYMLKHGVTENQLADLCDNPGQLDYVGLDIYFHNTEHFWQDQRNGRPGHSKPHAHPKGFAAVIMEYIDHFAGISPHINFKWTEFNSPGFIEDRITSLKYALYELDKVNTWLEKHAELQYGRPMQIDSFHWYPIICSVGWWDNEMCCVEKCYSNGSVRYDGNGLFIMDGDDPKQSELSQWYYRLSTGKATWRDLPAYEFNPDMAADLAGYIRLMPFEWVTTERTAQPFEFTGGFAR